jgi:hypothetical protein
MWRKPKALVVALVAAAVVIGGCGLGEAGNSVAGAGASASSSPRVTAPEAGPKTGPADGIGVDVEPGAFHGSQIITLTPADRLVVCTKGPLNGCSQKAMEKYGRSLEGEMQRFFQQEFPNLVPPEVKFINHGAKGPNGCGNPVIWTETTSADYEYCRADNTFYMGVDTLWEMYSNGGYLAPALAMAHEYTHHVQHYSGSMNQIYDLVGKNLNNKDYVASLIRILEDLADCGSGVWLQHAIDQHIAGANPGVIPPYTKWLESKRTNNTHGDLAERTSAIAVGRKGGFDGCSAKYYPKSPLRNAKWKGWGH